MDLTWTSPGDDGSTGTASQYDIRYSTSPITGTTWAGATPCEDEPVPKPAASSENFTVTGLSPNTTYYFGLKTADEAANWSDLSNPASAATEPPPDVTPPAAVVNLAAANPAPTSMDLTWTSPGDDGNTGTAFQYDIRYSTSPITAATWDGATPCEGEPVPKPAASSENFTVTNLIPNTTYYFGLKTADEAANWSDLSNVASGVTASATTYVFAGKWGTEGSDDGEFSNPFGVAVGASGNVYVADVLNNRIQKFTSGGVFLTLWGGLGDGQFNYPYGVAVDGIERVYVTDLLLNVVKKFSSDGEFLAALGAPLTMPHAVAVDASSNIYVADTGANRIRKFTSDGSLVATWGSTGSGDGQMNGPQGIAVDGFGNVYVADTGNDRVQKFTSVGGLLAKWGTSGAGSSQFDRPRGIAVDASGNVYVSDSGNSRIQQFTSTGGFLAVWGSAGSNDGELAGPGGIAVDASGRVYVADTGNNRIQKFAPAP
jgi:sugar lactone lactonase YvrE